MAKRRIAPPLIAGAVCLTALAGATAHATPDYAAINRTIVETQVIPGYRALAGTMALLNETVEAFCAAPSPAGLERARAAFRDAFLDWAAIQHIRFGPIESRMRNFRVQFWPDTRGRAGRHLSALIAASDPASLDPQTFGLKSVAVQGLPALERLLYAGDATLETFQGDDGGAFRCRVAVAIAANLSTIAERILTEWTDGEAAFGIAIRAPGGETAAFASHKEATGALFNSFATALQLLRDLKLAGPLGKAVDNAKPRRAEAWRSRLSMEAVAVNLRAMRRLFGTASAPGLNAALLSAAPDTARMIERRIAAAVASAETVSLPLADAVTDPAARPAVVNLAAKVAGIEAMALPALVEGLDMPLGFNSFDGD